LRPILEFLKKGVLSRSWWLMPIILASWEAEIRRIAVQDQPEQKKLMRPPPILISKSWG
jgi:hypothetical protein